MKQLSLAVFILLFLAIGAIAQGPTGDSYDTDLAYITADGKAFLSKQLAPEGFSGDMQLFSDVAAAAGKGERIDMKKTDDGWVVETGIPHTGTFPFCFQLKGTNQYVPDLWVRKGQAQKIPEAQATPGKIVDNGSRGSNFWGEPK
jgi:hypothetical protein